MKSLRFPPGTFIELDDLAGGRKVAMVCKDGVTYWDLLDIHLATPLNIHPVMHAQELGSLVQFSISRGLQEALRLLAGHLQQQADPRLETDPLFVMRALWALGQKSTGEGYLPDAQALGWAVAQAEQQAQAALRLHRLAEQYCAQPSA